MRVQFELFSTCEGLRNIFFSTLRSGFDDILFAIPVTESKLPRLTELNEKIDLKLLINNIEMVESLKKAECKVKWKVFVEVSTGYEVLFRDIPAFKAGIRSGL